MSKPNKPKIVTLVGRGYFPLDMLRHDCCWPLHHADVIEIVDSLSDDPLIRWADGREIRVTNATGKWNPERWARCGWTLKE